MWSELLFLPHLAALLSTALLCDASPTAPAPSPLSLSCQQLDVIYSSTNGSSTAVRSVSAQGLERTLRVLWDGRAPGRAAAALLVTALRHVARYTSVQLALGPSFADHPYPTFCSLAAAYNQLGTMDTNGANYTEVLLSPTMPILTRCPYVEHCVDRSGRDQWVGEPRLKLEGPAAARTALALHLHLASGAARPKCADANSWDFYKDTTYYRLCMFTHSEKSGSPAIVYTLAEHKNVIDELKQRIEAQALHLEIVPLHFDAQPRNWLLHLLKEDKTSFLFLDYDFWNDDKNVIPVMPPPSLSHTPGIALESVLSARIADNFILKEIAPTVLETLQKFAPAPAALRRILELEEEHPEHNIEDAACSWAIDNKREFESFYLETKQQHWIAVFLCAKDPDKKEYERVANTIIAEHGTDAELGLRINLYFVNIDCENEEELSKEYFRVFLSHRWQRLIGVVAAGTGMEAAVEGAPAVETALVLYDVPEPRAQLGARARAAAGTVQQLATAITYFLAQFGWKRLALLTENTDLALGLYEALEFKDELKIYNAVLFGSNGIVETLITLQQKKARIIFVNTNAAIAEVILCKAYELGMTDRTEYAWIVRERRAAELKCGNATVDVNHFTISFWWRGGDDSLLTVKGGGEKSGAVVRKRLSELWPSASWPPLAAPLADALQLLTYNFKVFTRRYPKKIYDIHGYGSTELLLNMHNRNINGVAQQLKFSNSTIDEPLVFVDRWQSDRHEPLQLLRIVGKNVKVLANIQPNIYNDDTPSDGSVFCIILINDTFPPQCRDHKLYIALGLLLLICVVLYIARRVRLKQLARRDALLTAQLLAQREFAANALVQHYVDRAALELYHELGHGCYGRVRYGVLRAPERPPVSVAVKESRGDFSPVEESDLLREACTMASLRHDHIVRLVGVCATGGPVLLLMEYAFFGDLREYLCQRRHLAQRLTQSQVDESDEMYHVSAKSLTRLGKEVASALEYLADERLVHRDVRASNCLVDARRSLKLGDFGLARSTRSGSAGEAQYTCERRGLLPALWMAPESLERLVFTPASDVWALGVLLLELVTLGARPYATWSTMRVMRYVSSGGCPPVPHDASCDTQRILTRCWQTIPEERLTARALVALLEARPESLRPALQPAVPPDDYPTADGPPAEPA